MTVPIEAVQATRFHRATSISFSAIHSNQVAAKRHCVSPRTGQALSITHREWPVRSGQSYVQSVFLRDIVPGLHSWEMRFTGVLYTNADRLQCHWCVLGIDRSVQSLVRIKQRDGGRISHLVLWKLYLWWLDLTGDKGIFWLVSYPSIYIYINSPLILNCHINCTLQLPLQVPVVINYCAIICLIIWWLLNILNYLYFYIFYENFCFSNFVMHFCLFLDFDLALIMFSFSFSYFALLISVILVSLTYCYRVFVKGVIGCPFSTSWYDSLGS